MIHLEEKALEFAAIKHEGQMDDQGRPYFFAHIIQVYSLLKDVTDDEEILCAGILHDTVEDTNTTYEEIVHEFTKEIADLVMEVTFEGDDETGRYFPRLHSNKAIVIKFADRLSRKTTCIIATSGQQNQKSQKINLPFVRDLEVHGGEIA